LRDGGAAGAFDAGDAGAFDAGPPERFLPADAYCEEIAPFFCDYYLRCGLMAVADVATCRSRFSEGCEGRFEPRYVGLASAGLLRLDTEGLAACSAHLGNVTCGEQRFELSGPCSDIWHGEVAEGGACGFDVESFVCAEGTTCRLDLSLCGECVAANALGEPCAGEGCVDGATCQDGVCVQRLVVGGTCGTDTPPCLLGASCDNGICRFPEVVALGDACDSDHRCPYETACLGSVCTQTAALGEPCAADLPCTSGFCSQGSCIVLAGPGASCEENAECFANRCDNGTCVAFPSACLN